MIVIPRVTKPLVVQQSPIPRQNLALWLRADRGVVLDTTSTPTVSQWLDQSGNGNHLTQDTKTSQAFLKQVDGFNVVSFEGSQFYTGVSFPNISEFSLYIVAKAPTVGGYNSLVRFQGGSAPGFLVYPYTFDTFNHAILDQETVWRPTGFLAGEWNKGAFTYKIGQANSGYQTYRNSGMVSQASAIAASLPVGALATFGSYMGTSEFSNAYVKHILLYSKKHTEVETLKILSKL